MNAALLDEVARHPVRVTQLIEYGVIFETMFSRIREANLEYDKSGSKRSKLDLIRFFIKSLQITIENIRLGSEIFDHYEVIPENSEGLRLTLSELPLPLPLIFLMLELFEIHEGRRSPVLERNLKNRGAGYYHRGRRYVRAGGAAALQALINTGMSQDAGARLIADAVNKISLRRRAKPYTPAAIKNWLRSRKKKADFELLYDLWCGHFCKLSDEAKRLSRPGDPCIQTAMQKAVISLLISLIDAFAFGGADPA